MSETVYGIVTPTMTKTFRTYQKQPHVCEFKRNSHGGLDIVTLYKFDKHLQLTKINTSKNENPFIRYNNKGKEVHKTIYTEFDYLNLSGTDGELLFFDDIKNAMATKMLFMDFLQGKVLVKIEEIKTMFNKNMPVIYDVENTKKIKEKYAEYFI